VLKGCKALCGRVPLRNAVTPTAVFLKTGTDLLVRGAAKEKHRKALIQRKRQ
jgi:hypothetical protein